MHEARIPPIEVDEFVRLMKETGLLFKVYIKSISIWYNIRPSDKLSKTQTFKLILRHDDV